MPSVEETAYPRLKSNPSPESLEMLYTPTARDLLNQANRAGRAGDRKLPGAAQNVSNGRLFDADRPGAERYHSPHCHLR